MKSKSNYFLSEKHFFKTYSGNKIPKIIYGTAWKKDRTKALVCTAVSCGFRAIDTACQPKHYNESQVGEALSELISKKQISRESIFLQTKFTATDGQDLSKPLPYDQNASLTEQAQQSIEKSLENLKTNYLDSLLMHSPMHKWEDTYKVWCTFEEYVRAGKIKSIGISNCYSLPLLEKLWEKAEIKPSIVQNRFHAQTGYDKEIRKFCSENGIVYQSFWTLTANPQILDNAKTAVIANKYGKTPAQVFFKFVMQIGIAPLSGTSSETHMKEDLEVLEMQDLLEDEVKQFETFL